MTSFDHVMIPTRGNWFQTNPRGHKSNDRAGNTASPVCVCVLPMVKILHFSGKFDQHLSLYCGSVKPKFKTGPGYGIFCESRMSYDFQNLLTILAQFLQISLYISSSNVYPNLEKNGAFSLSETSVNGKVPKGTVPFNTEFHGC